MKAPALKPLSFELKKKLKEKKQQLHAHKKPQFLIEEVYMGQDSDAGLSFDPDLNVTQQLRHHLEIQKTNTQKNQARSLPLPPKNLNRQLPSQGPQQVLPIDPRYQPAQVKINIANRQIENQPFSKTPSPQLIKNANEKAQLERQFNTTKIYPKQNLLSNQLVSLIQPPKPEPKTTTKRYQNGNEDVLEKKMTS